MIFKPKTIFIAGTNYTLVNDTKIIKIPNKSRISNLQIEFQKCGIWEIVSKNEELKKFKYASNGKGSLDSNGVLILEKIDARPLSSFLNTEEFLSLFEKSIEKLIELENRFQFSHGDFHIDNILVDKQQNILFIDFDYGYTQKYLHNTSYKDILHLLFIMKREYKSSFSTSSQEIQNIVERYFQKDKLQIVMQEMQCFFKIGYKELW